MSPAKYVFHSDPGHGWLAVAAADVRALGFKPTAYSYISPDGGKVYLEEDCDAPAFLALYEKAHGARPAIVDARPCRGDFGAGRRHVNPADFPGVNYRQALGQGA